MGEATLFAHNLLIFRCLEKIILQEVQKLHRLLNFISEFAMAGFLSAVF